MENSILVIVNQAAGALNPIKPGTDEIIYHTRKILTRADVALTESEEQAGEIVRDRVRRGVGTVVAAGGDGTARHIAGILAGTGAAMGILPLGSSNNIARSLGLPLSVRGALKVIHRGRTRAIDVGYAGPHHFIEAAGIGLHADTLRLYQMRREKSLVKAVYSIGRALAGREPFRVRLDVGGRVFEREIVQATFSNLPIYGYGFRIAPRARISDGRLDATLIGLMSPPALPWFVVLAKAGMLGLAPSVSAFRAKNVKVTTETPMPVHVDAETPCETPVEITVKRKVLRVITS